MHTRKPNFACPFHPPQSRSSTGALVTGLTEKLNQKRIKSSMDFAGVGARAKEAGYSRGIAVN